MTGQFAVLTAPGSAAIATFALWGTGAWEAVRTRFRSPNGKPLPDRPALGATRFGRLGGDEVILAATGESAFEVHCHGGPVVQRMLIGLFEAAGLERKSAGDWLTEFGYGTPPASEHTRRAWSLLPGAPTRRTTGILVDQLAVADAGSAGFAEVGRHLVRPWKVAIAGPPNVGKSSLVNALAGYERSIVAPIPGTTRDAVSVSIAFDGWPVELTDTAGLRETADAIEEEGIRRAWNAIAEADLLLWMTDTERWADRAEPADRPLRGRVLKVVNKVDLEPRGEWTDWLPISTAAPSGLAELIAAIVLQLVPAAPPPGAVVLLPGPVTHDLKEPRTE